MTEGPVVPVDDASLDLLEEAMDCVVTGKDEEGNRTYSGEFTLSQLLDFWSGYDKSLCEKIGESNGVTMQVYRGGYLLDSTSVIRALIAEIRRLREEQ